MAVINLQIFMILKNVRIRWEVSKHYLNLTKERCPGNETRIRIGVSEGETDKNQKNVLPTVPP